MSDSVGKIGLLDYKECLTMLEPKHGCGPVAATAMLAFMNRYDMTNVVAMKRLRDQVLDRFKSLTEFYGRPKDVKDVRLGMTILNETMIAFAMKYGLYFNEVSDQNLTLTDVHNKFGMSLMYTGNRRTGHGHIVFVANGTLYGTWDARFCSSDKPCRCYRNQSYDFHEMQVTFALVPRYEMGIKGRRYDV